jgi:hypothetical protein
MGMTVLTESRRRTCKSSRGSGRLGGWAVEDGSDTRRVAGDAYGVRYSWRFNGLSLKTIGRTVSGFRPQNPGGGSEKERTARGGIKEFVSRQSYLMKRVVTVG